MKKSFSLSLFLAVLVILITAGEAFCATATNAYCAYPRNFLTGEFEGVKFDMSDIYPDKKISDNIKKEMFVIACESSPENYTKERMQIHFVHAVCSDSLEIVKMILKQGYITQNDAFMLKRTDNPNVNDYENFEVNAAGLAAYIGRVRILNYIMNEMPSKAKIKRPFLWDNVALSGGEKTLYRVALEGRCEDDKNNPAQPFAEFLNKENKKWDAIFNDKPPKNFDDISLAINNRSVKGLDGTGKTRPSGLGLGFDEEINELLRPR